MRVEGRYRSLRPARYPRRYQEARSGGQVQHFGRRWEYEPGLFHHSRLAMLSPTGAATKVRPAIPARAQILNLADTGGSNGYRPHA
jgi:hypothetical protein